MPSLIDRDHNEKRAPIVGALLIALPVFTQTVKSVDELLLCAFGVKIRIHAKSVIR